MKPRILHSFLSLVLAAGLWVVVAWWGIWQLGILAVAAAEVPWRARLKGPWPWLRLVAGLAAVTALATYPVWPVGRLVVAGIYAAYLIWLTWEVRLPAQSWTVQFLAFEALFVWMATGGVPRSAGAALVWLAVYAATLAGLAGAAGELAPILAATWALVAAEIGWVLSAWLVTYVLPLPGLLLAQPALVLAGVGYCFGNIYLAQRQGQLSRWRFTEFLVVGIILIAIVVVGTNWRATV